MLMIFAQMLEIVALSDLASVLCARKFSFAPQGVDPKLLSFHFYLLLFYYLFIIIFEALRLVAAIFMFFFLIWPLPRDLSIARLLVLF